jgi:hypothetical protein
MPGQACNSTSGSRARMERECLVRQPTSCYLHTQPNRALGAHCGLAYIALVPAADRCRPGQGWRRTGQGQVRTTIISRKPPGNRHAIQRRAGSRWPQGSPERPWACRHFPRALISATTISAVSMISGGVSATSHLSSSCCTCLMRSIRRLTEQLLSRYQVAAQLLKFPREPCRPRCSLASAFLV